METAIQEARPKPLRTKRSEEIVEKLEKKYQDENAELRSLTNFILTVLPDEFADVRKVSFKIFFSERPPLRDKDAICRKLDDAVRFKLKVDYFILIWKESFDGKSQPDKAKLIIHELHHIMQERSGDASIRPHNETEDFCELPRHDLYSEKVFLKIRDRLKSVQPSSLAGT
jgi:Putative phage metallopeptidase